MNSLILIGVLICLSIQISFASVSNWEEFKQVYNKNYENEAEENLRKEIFAKNIEFIKQFETVQHQHTFTVKMNEFGDLTAEEFGSKFRQSNLLQRRNIHATVPQMHASVVGDVPASKDWRQSGCLSPVQNQGQCGSVWAIAAKELIQDMWCIQHGKFVALSAQNLYDCVPGSMGCNGGLMSSAFDYCVKTGIDSAASYPETGSTGPCKAKQGIMSAQCKFVHQIPSGNESALVEILGTVGPVACTIDAGNSGFQFYSSGIFTGPCGKDLNHIVLAVGYGGSGSQSYYILQNSWGSSWGMQGYMMLQRGKDLCGVADAAYYLQVL